PTLHREGQGEKETARQNPGGLRMKGVRLARLERDLGFDFFLGLGRRRGRDGLNTDLELDLVTEDKSTGFQRLVPGQVVVFTVQLGLRLEAQPTTAPRILALAIEAGVERDFPALSVDRQVAAHLAVRWFFA